MQDISVVELLSEIIDDEKKTIILKMISEGLYADDLLDQLLDNFHEESEC